MVLLLGFIATTAWGKFKKRRDQDSQEWLNGEMAEKDRSATQMLQEYFKSLYSENGKP